MMPSCNRGIYRSRKHGWVRNARASDSDALDRAPHHGMHRSLVECGHVFAALDAICFDRLRQAHALQLFVLLPVSVWRALPLHMYARSVIVEPHLV